MSDCIDPRYEKMLHGFELGLLSEADRQAFEEHLLDCDHCYELAKKLLPASILLRHDAGLRVDVVSDADSMETALPERDRAESRMGWFNLTRSLAIAALIILAAIPVYWFGLRDAGGPDVTQRLVFTTVRGGTPPILNSEKDGLVELVFAPDSVAANPEYSIMVSSRDGESVLYENEHFADFDSAGIGSVSLPISDFSPGFYVLSITPRSDDPALSKRQYNFRVK